MRLFRFFKQETSAPVAKERLKILLAHERQSISDQDLIAVLQKEVVAAICKHISLDPDKVELKMNQGQMMSTLEINIEIEPQALENAHRERDCIAA